MSDIQAKIRAREAMANKLAVAGRRSLHVYAKAMWPIVEPMTHFVDGWHIGAICEHLQAVSRGEIRRLIINMPPRHMKSLLLSVFWQTWTWIDWAESRWLYSSYAESLSKRDSLKCRRIIEHPYYQQIFRPQWQLASDQNEKMRFENTVTGYRIASSVGGAATGEGGDFIVCDDPHKAAGISSKIIRERTIDWWREEMSTRGNDPKTVRKVIVMQRLHEKDLSGELLGDGGWTHLMIPARYESSRSISTPIWKDPRKVDGELLWPSRMGEKEINELSREMGPTKAQGQLQQNPAPSDGGLFKRSWWKFYGPGGDIQEPPDRQAGTVFQFRDCAQKPGISNDYSTCATWLWTPSAYFLLDFWRGKVTAPDLESLTKVQFAKWTPDAVVIEDASAGSSLIQVLQAKTTIPVVPFSPHGRDKEVRATAATPTVENGTCYLPIDAPWVEDFILEHERFPLSEHDDQVDTTSMMVEHFKKFAVALNGPNIRRL